MNKVRFEAFSDGVFAFAITLLILGIALPAFPALPSEGVLTSAILDLWPHLLAYALSFALIGIMWQNHQALFRLVATVDRTTVFLNLGLLGGTAFIPFAMTTLGSYPAMRPSTFLYGVTLIWFATTFNLMLNHLAATRAFLPDVSDAVIRQTLVVVPRGVGDLCCRYGPRTTRADRELHALLRNCGLPPRATRRKCRRLNTRLLTRQSRFNAAP